MDHIYHPVLVIWHAENYSKPKLSSALWKIHCPEYRIKCGLLYVLLHGIWDRRWSRKVGRISVLEYPRREMSVLYQELYWLFAKKFFYSRNIMSFFDIFSEVPRCFENVVSLGLQFVTSIYSSSGFIPHFLHFSNFFDMSWSSSVSFGTTSCHRQCHTHTHSYASLPSVSALLGTSGSTVQTGWLKTVL